VQNTARLADALPNLDFVMSMALPSDMPSATSDRHSFRAMIANTVKPLVFTAWDEEGLADIIKMAAAVVGGPETLQLNPCLLAYLEPTSPLQHSEVVLRKVLMMADHGLPFVYAPGPVDGASAPMTPAGSLAMANAEVLSGLVIAQRRRKGTPFVWGSGSGPLDMRHTTATYASPEFMLHCMGMAELAHHTYNLPVWGFSGCSDSKLPDIQAGIESALWILWTALSGANLVHDVGYIESGLTCSPEMVVLGDEIIGFVRRLMGGVPLTPETLALHVIDEIGPGGDFLSHDHTFNHFKDTWYPRLFDRRMHQEWNDAGRPTALQSARELAREIIAGHEVPPLPETTLTDLEAILLEADARAGM
jgi:trimethylamine--corrinoid protein Co-methyltransferase